MYSRRWNSSVVRGSIDFDGDVEVADEPDEDDGEGDCFSLPVEEARDAREAGADERCAADRRQQ